MIYSIYCLALFKIWFMTNLKIYQYSLLKNVITSLVRSQQFLWFSCIFYPTVLYNFYNLHITQLFILLFCSINFFVVSMDSWLFTSLLITQWSQLFSHFWIKNKNYWFCCRCMQNFWEYIFKLPALSAPEWYCKSNYISY